MCIFTVLLLSICAIDNITAKRLKTAVKPGRNNQWQNDIIWELYKEAADGSRELLDEGSGIDNYLVSVVDVEPSDCLVFNFTDLYGDGIAADGGNISVYFGEEAITSNVESVVFDGAAKSDLFRLQGKGGEAGFEEYLLQNGSAPFGGCHFPNQNRPNTGCHETTAVDIIFLLDTSGDLSFDCHHYYFQSIIDLIENNIPRQDLNIAIVTFGTSVNGSTIIKKPLNAIVGGADLKSISFPNEWYNTYKDAIAGFSATQCIGGSHATVDGLNAAIDIFLAQYPTTAYDNINRQEYIVLYTDEYIDTQQTKLRFSCEGTKATLQVNGIQLIILAETTYNQHLECLADANNNNIIAIDQFSFIHEQYGNIQALLCSSYINVAITEIFVDETNGRYWIEIVNLGFAFNISALSFTSPGNLLLGGSTASNDANQTLINQGDIFVIGNEAPCDIYFPSSIGVDNYDCDNYFSSDYNLPASVALNEFIIALNDGANSQFEVSASDNFLIDDGYSYELEIVFNDFTDLSSWRESCYLYGSPGVLNLAHCPKICDPLKCTRYDSNAQCSNSGTSCYDIAPLGYPGVDNYTYCVPSQCQCSSAYFSDIGNTGSCLLVVTPLSCAAYVTSVQNSYIEVSFQEPLNSSYYASAISIVSYNIYYGAASETDNLYPNQPVSITYGGFQAGEVQMSLVGIDRSDNSSIESQRITCPYTYAPTRRPTMTDETWDPSATPTLSPVTTALPSVSPTKAPTYAGCGSSLLLDLIFILDSSGSVYDGSKDGDPEYNNWQQELDFAKAIVNSSLPGDTKVAAINFSGCGPSWDFASCQADGKLKKMWGLTDFGIPNNQIDVYNRFAAMGPGDFNGGYTWTNEALTIALREFQGNSSDDRSKMIIILTDGEPFPVIEDPDTGVKTPDHEPCIAATGYVSPTLAALQALDVTIVAIGIDVSTSTIDDFFTCVVEDFDKYFFYATDFDALKGLVSAIGTIVCSADIILIINEVGLNRDYGPNGEDLYFIELYNPSVGVSLTGFRFEGLINFTIEESGYGVAQGQYWVISTYDMFGIDQTEAGCRGCGQDLLVDDIYADTNMNNDYWKLSLFNGAGDEVDFVERNRDFFPIVNTLFTHELITEDLDNILGGNWEESCYVYGTPQSPNQEPCPCRYLKCIAKGDKAAYCGTGTDGKCVCSDDYILSGGVCIPLYSPDCCYTFKENCAANIILLAWCSPSTSAVESYRIYKNGEIFQTVASTVTEIELNGSSCVQPVTNYAVTTIFQSAPLIESPKTFCNLTDPTVAPTVTPTTAPSLPTVAPTLSPTTAQPTTSEPTLAPTPFVCDTIIVYSKYQAPTYSDAVIDLQGNYHILSNSSSLAKWTWKRDRLATMGGIYYSDSNNVWVIQSVFAYLVSAANDSGALPPYSQSYATGQYTNWTDTFDDKTIELMLVCGGNPPPSTPHPTPTPVVLPPTIPPLPNCTQLIVTSDAEPQNRDPLTLQLDLDSPPLSDGKGIWTDGTYTISWYDMNQRWTFYDGNYDELYFGPVALSSLSDPVQENYSGKWSYISSRYLFYEFSIECISTPIPPPALSPTFPFDPCAFPDDIVHYWHLDHLRTWDICYQTTYSDGSTATDLEDLCLTEITDNYGSAPIDVKDVYIFVGAVEKTNLDYAYIGAYGHVSILQDFTSSLQYAYQTTYDNQYPQQTYWYYVENVAFGFTDAPNGRINLAQGGCDIYDTASNNALCWHMINSQTGGWRAGNQIGLNFERNIYKVIYYKQCNTTLAITTPAPTLGVCATIDISSTDYALTVLNDYGIMNDFRYSWQDSAPPSNDFELGWLAIESAWLFDTEPIDGKRWLHADNDPSSTFPPFDPSEQPSIWYNQADPSQTIELVLSCNSSEFILTHSPSPPDQILCDCIQVDTSGAGLSAIDGYYKHSNDTTNDGGDYYRPKDKMRLYYDTNLETWLITGNGAYFEFTDAAYTPNVDPTQLPPFGEPIVFTDAITSLTVNVTFSCGVGVSCLYSPLCPTYNEWDYVDAEYEYTSETQMGFAINPTENEDVNEINIFEFERQYDEFLYSRHNDQSVIKLAISDYILPYGNVTFSRELYPPILINLVYDSLDFTIHRDSAEIGLWFQLFDKYGSTFIDLSNVTISVWASCPDCASFTTLFGINDECDIENSVINVFNDGGFNAVKCNLTVSDWLFIENDTNILQIHAELSDNSGAVLNKTEIIELTLAPRIVAKGIDFAGIYGEFAMSPRYVGEEVRLDLWLNSDDLANRQRYAQAWWLSIDFNHALLQYVSFVADETIWGSIGSLYSMEQSNNNGLIEIWGSKIGQLLNTNGGNISVGYFLFSVYDDTAAGLYASVLSFVTISMSGDNGYAITNNAEGRMADINGWYTVEASLQVLADDPIDIFVQVDTINLWNTAFISGTEGRAVTFPIFVVYHFSVRSPTSLACTKETSFLSFFLTTTGVDCNAIASAYQTEYGEVYVNITADAIKSIQILNVWLPLLSTFAIIPYNTGTKEAQFELSQIDMAYRAVGDIYYESLPLYIYCNFTLDGADTTTSAVVINELLNEDSFAISDDNVAEIIHFSGSLSRFLIHGLSTGQSHISLQLASPWRHFVSIPMIVGNPAPLVTIIGFGGVLVTHIEVEVGRRQHVVGIDPPGTDSFTIITILSDLKQHLSASGDIASVHAFMKLSDGVLIDLSDDENIVYSSVMPQYLEIINVDKSGGANMGEAGAYAVVSDALFEQIEWSSLIQFDWNVPRNLSIGSDRLRGVGCIYGSINKTNVLNVSVTLSCNTTIITRQYDPANYIFGLPIECFLIVTVFWSDGTQTDLSTDNRTNYDIIPNYNLLILENKNVVRANLSCNISTDFSSQNANCYGSDIIEVSFSDYPILANWSDRISVEVVIFDRLQVTAYPYPNYTAGSDASILNKFYCLSEYEMSELVIFGNLTNGIYKELTQRNDIIINVSNSSALEIENSKRLTSGIHIGSADVMATLFAQNVNINRDNYYSNIISYDITNAFTDITAISLHTFNDRNNVFSDIINSRELLKMDVFFSDGLIINDILHEIIENSLLGDGDISIITEMFNFSSSDPAVLAVDGYGYVTILDNWWREVNISVVSKCSDGAETIFDIESIFPNLKPDFWDIDIEASTSITGLQFENKDISNSEPFTYDIYINASSGTLLSFSIRIWWDDNLFIENGTGPDQCSYFEEGSNRESWPQCTTAGDWEGQMLSWNIDTIRGELRLAGASSSGSSTNSSLQHVASCNMKVSAETESNISMVIGQIIEISYIDDVENIVKHVYDKEIVAGDGYQQINSGQTIKNELPPNIFNRYSFERSINYQCSNEINDENIFSSNSGSDCCSDALFVDVNYDCRHTAFDAQATSFYLNDIDISVPVVAISDLSYSQRIAMDPSLDYLQNDRNTCSDLLLSNPCPNGLEDIWYSLQVSTGKFLYLNVSSREETLVQDGRVLRGFAPMFLEEYSSVFRFATDNDATVFFELKNVTQSNRDAFVLIDSLSIGTLIPESQHNIANSIIIRGEYISDKYWTFATNEYNWTDNNCIFMSILYETYDESGSALSCTQIDREYAFRGSAYFNDLFIEFTELCVQRITNDPTTSPTLPPTSSPINSDLGPILTDCRFEDHGTAILMFFSEDTNRARFGGKPFSCLSVFTPATFNNIEGMTSDSRCIWKDFRTLRIELGYGFNIRASFGEDSYYLELVGNNILDFDEFSSPTNGYCIVYPMFNPPPVFANILGATQLGPCDDLRLLGTPTSGQAAPMSWQWILLNANGLLANGCVFGSEAIPTNREILEIPHRCLAPTSFQRDINYFIQLNATNYYFSNFNYAASTSSNDITITIKAQESMQLPAIKLLTPSIINITNEQDLVVATFVSVNDGSECGSVIKTDLDLFSFEWESLTLRTDIEGIHTPFGSAFSSNIDTDNFIEFDMSAIPSLSSSSSTLIIPGQQLEAGKYYAFKVTVTYNANNAANSAFVGVIVSLPIPYPKPSIMYQSVREGDDIVLDISNFYDFSRQPATDYGIEWQCLDLNNNESILEASVVRSAAIITLNENNANLAVGNFYNCSAHLYSTSSSTLGITWGRRESYFVFEYISSDPVQLIATNSTHKLISVQLSTNIGIINRNKRIVISASFVDSFMAKNTIDDGLYFDNYAFVWRNFGKNYNLFDNVYGISIIDHIDYERGYTVNFVVDDEVNRFVFDGEKYGFELAITNTKDFINGDVEYGGYGQIELIANRGPNGGLCAVDLIYDSVNIYRVECYGWTDEYMELGLEYNFMLLHECNVDSDCGNELICDLTQSEYNVGVCILSTVGVVQNYLREWTSGNNHYFALKNSNNYILRSFIRDYSGFVTTFDTPFSGQQSSEIEDYEVTKALISSAADAHSTTAFAANINAFDSWMDAYGTYDRSDIVQLIYEMYTILTSSDNNLLFDRFYDYNKIYSLIMDELFYDFRQFDPTKLNDLPFSQNVAKRNFAIISDMISYFNSKRDGLNNGMIPRDLSVYELISMTWAGNSAMQQSDLPQQIRQFNKLKNLYRKQVLGINALGLNERLIDETHYNVSFRGLTILSGWETKSKLFSDDSDCGGDLVDLAPNFESDYFGGQEVAYVKCELIAFNGGILTPTAISESMSSAIIFWTLKGYQKNGDEVSQTRRRLVTFDECSPFLYTIPHNANTSLKSYSTRRLETGKQPYSTWSVCKTILVYENITGDGDFDDLQAPNAEDCYVLTHDEEKTVCACQSNYTLLGVEEELYYPQFKATLSRYNPDFTWTGLMQSVSAMLWLLILFFLFTFAFYILPSYDKHKALLAVKKGLPKSQREGAYFQTAEGKTYRAARINMNNLSFCQVYIEVYKIRLRNDHLCLWWCCDDPGSNISHFIKVLLTVLYCLLFMLQIAWFYGAEKETVFADTLFAFLIAFETILPIWLCAWCISKIRPHEFSDEEIDEMVEDQMAIITKNQKWEDDYESDIEHGGDDEFDEKEDVLGVFAVPQIFDDDIENQNNWDILRIYTDIDEEVEYLEENFMPQEMKWYKKKRKAYSLKKIGYVAMDDDDGSADSVNSYEERRGFEGQSENAHFSQARDAESLGFIPTNVNEEYDAAASKMLHENQKENIQHKRGKHERENSVSSKISSMFSRTNKSSQKKKKEKKEKKEKKRRRSSRLSQLLSFGSKKDVEIDDKPQPEPQEKESEAEAEEQYYSNEEPEREQEQEQYYSDEEEEDEDEDEDDYDYEEDEEDQDDDDDEESETSSEKRKRRKREKRKNKKKKKKKKVIPTNSGMNAPKPMQNESSSKRNKKRRKKGNENENEIEIELEEIGSFSRSEIVSGEFIAVHLNCQRKYVQFNKILQIGRINRLKIKNNPKLLLRIVDNAISSGDLSLIGSKKIVRRAAKLISSGDPLFDEIESGATNKNQKHIQKLLRKQDVINTVFANVDPNNMAKQGGGFAYSPAELRKLEELPERAPSQRPQQEKKTNIGDELWQQSLVVFGGGEMVEGEVRNNKNINMDDIWEVTGALPPELLDALEDPYDPWKENELKPIQKPLRDDEEEEYRDKLSNHFKQRRDLLQRKYWLPRWCRYVVWLILLVLIVLFIVLFLQEGNKLGAAFLWIPQQFNSTNCTVSISEQTRFDYDYSLDEAERRNPACSPQEIEGSMPHCWDYRVRFSIASVITFLTSIILVQPLYIAILALIAITCLPICKPCCISIRNMLCGLNKEDPGYKHFLGGTILISGDTNLEYGQLADEELTQISQMSGDGSGAAEEDESQGSAHRDSKTTPLLT